MNFHCTTTRNHISKAKKTRRSSTSSFLQFSRTAQINACGCEKFGRRNCFDATSVMVNRGTYGPLCILVSLQDNCTRYESELLICKKMAGLQKSIV